MRLTNYSQLSAVLRLKSGARIGTGEKVERGESLPVMVSPRTKLPYIPGSSLKGKMRSLLELLYGRLATDPRDPGSPCWCGKCPVCILFGSGSSANTFEPTRLIFRDTFLTESSAELIEKVDLEDKPGVRIDRITGKAAGGALFPMKRIPEGCEFDFGISARIFEKDNKENFRKILATGLYLMEQDALGGGGSRGSGWIGFSNIEWDGKKFNTNWQEEIKGIIASIPKK